MSKIIVIHVRPPIPARDHDWCAYHDDDGKGVIANCPLPQAGGVFEVSANARLIAAAPEMLEALIVAKSSLETLGIDGWSEAPHLLQIIRAAIAKALGTTE